MPSSRKRNLRDVESEPVVLAPQEDSLLHRIRNTWQFANLFQWIFLFGKVVKIDESIDIDVLESECLKPQSTVLVDIGLCLLKFVSSHRGLTPELFDEYTRRQYVAKNPTRNPFGIEEEPARFNEFDIFTKLRVLHQLTQWIMLHYPERIRERMEEQRPSDQTDWRIEPYGWDKDDREYFLLDDDRLYRRTEAPPPVSEWKPKKNSKKAKAAARAAKRRRISRTVATDAEDSDREAASETEEAPQVPEDNGFGGAKWECIAVSLDEVQTFLNTIRKTRDDNEKILRDRIEEGLVPILEKHAESRKRKILAREKELLSLEKMAHAKRSSRLAGKVERQRHEEEARHEDERRQREEAAARKEDQLRLKREKERDNRLMSREKRLKERETRRQKHQEELAQLSEDSKNLDSNDSNRLSGRRLQAEISKNQQALEELEEEEDDWIFDCVCGVYGQVDDGTHSIACEQCSVWQHSKCAGISEKEAERDDFQFICTTCKRKAANKPTVIKLKVKTPGEASSSPPQVKSTGTTPHQRRPVSQRSDMDVEIPAKPQMGIGASSPFNGLGARPIIGAPSQQIATQSQLPKQTVIPVKPSSQSTVLPPPSPHANGDGANPFSSPHPTLSPPQQSPNKSRAYSTINQSPPIAVLNGNSGQQRILPPKGLFHISPKMNGTVPATRPSHADAAVPSLSAGTESPLKQPVDSALNTLTGLSTPSVSFSSTGRPSSSGASTSILSTPQLKHGHEVPGSLVKTPTLPPTQNGFSPLKRSPPSAQHSSNGSFSTPAPSILPPVKALSPTPSQQIMTPPVKPVEPVRPVSQQSNAAVKEA